MSEATASDKFVIQAALDDLLKDTSLIALVTAFVLKISILAWSGPAAAQSSKADLVKASQNPIANILSHPFQNNTLFGLGDADDTANLLNIEPVIPISVGDWNLINRTIIPVIDFPGLTVDLPRIPGVPEAPSSIRVEAVMELGQLFKAGELGLRRVVDGLDDASGPPPEQRRKQFLLAMNYIAKLKTSPLRDDCGIAAVELSGDHILLGLMDVDPGAWQ